VIERFKAAVAQGVVEFAKSGSVDHTGEDSRTQRLKQEGFIPPLLQMQIVLKVSARCGSSLAGDVL
jgi:hypothetical protein